MTILVLGATGTLGRQIVRQAIEMGYDVRCLVRNMAKTAFLREWGANIIYANLSLPETIPPILNGVSIIIDASTFRNNDGLDNLSSVDLVGKVALIKAAKTVKIKRFIFFSIFNNQIGSQTPLTKLKSSIENILIDSNIPYTIFQLPGFFQGLISQYAIPILEQEEVWPTQQDLYVKYIDTGDIAKIVLHSLNFSTVECKTFSVDGSKNLSSSDIINLCEKFSGQRAKTVYRPIIFFTFIQAILGFFKWGWEIQDRLAFSQNLTQSESLNENSSDLYSAIGLKKTNLLSLENYLREYYTLILKKLRLLKYDQVQTSRRKDLTF